MANDRMDKVDELIKREIAVILQRLFAEFLPTVTQVQIARDLSFGKIWITAAMDDDELLKLCKREAKEIRKELAGKVTLRKVPYLQFVLDKSEKEADKIDQLLNKIKDENEST